jgi:hypothetical protein
MKVRIIRLHRYNATPMTDAPQKPFFRRKRWIAAAAIVGVPLAATSVTAVSLLCLRRVPASVARPWDAFIALLAIAAINAAVAAGVPAAVAARMSGGRTAAKVVVAIACGATGLVIYVLACIASRPFLPPG